MIYFRYYGEPVAKGRPRITMRGGDTHAYTPKKTVEYEEAIRMCFMASTNEQMPIYPRGKKIFMRCEFGFAVPMSYSKKKTRDCLAGLIGHTKKPDIDNLIKAILDSLNSYCWEDDSQLVKITAEKQYANESYVIVEVWEEGEK